MLVAASGRYETPAGNGFSRGEIETLETGRSPEFDALGATSGRHEDTQQHTPFFAEAA